MIRRMGLSVLILALAGVLAGVAQDAKPPSPVAPSNVIPTKSSIELAVDAEIADRQHNDQVLEWLRKPTSVSFDDLPLSDVAAFLADAHQARIRLDTAAFLSAEVIARPVTTLAVERPLSHVLHRVAQSAGVGWTVERSEILFVPVIERDRRLETRVYRVGELLRLMIARKVALPRFTRGTEDGLNVGGQIAIDTAMAMLRPLIEQVPVSWQNKTGEGGTLTVLGDQLIVQQTYHGHGKVAKLLRCLEGALRRDAGSPPMLVMSPEERTEWVRLQKVMRREIDLRLVQTPLPDVVTRLRELLNEEVYATHDEINRMNNFEVPELTLTEGRYEVRDALQQALSPKNLFAVINDGAICITTFDKAQALRHAVIYDVADLASGRDDNNTLEGTIQQNTSGPWESSGGGGTISDPFGGLLVVHQHDTVHVEIALLLHELRQAQKESDKVPAPPRPDDLATRFLKTKSKEESEALERLILKFVAPSTWVGEGGNGLIRFSEDRLIIRQTKAVHDQIDQFLRNYQQAQPVVSPTK